MHVPRFQARFSEDLIMADKESEPSKQAEEAPPLDLNSLTGLDFGPSWADGSSSAGQRRFDGERGGRGGRPKGGFDRGGGSGGKERQDRRKSGAPTVRGAMRRFKGKGGRPAGGRGPAREEMFETDPSRSKFIPRTKPSTLFGQTAPGHGRTLPALRDHAIVTGEAERFVLVGRQQSAGPETTGECAPSTSVVPAFLAFRNGRTRRSLTY